jgi:hypothetical protein
MEIYHHPQANGEAIGDGLQVEDLPLIIQTGADGEMQRISTWKPDSKELEALANGGCIALWVFGNGPHPIVSVGVVNDGC